MINNKEEYLLITDYKEKEKYRHSLNRLVCQGFGFDFEAWYKQGFWTDKYRPYSFLHNDEIVANVSVNPIDFLVDGELLHTLQIGTVVTDQAYRHRGLSKELMNIVLKEYEGNYDLIYLYANDSAVEFYPKFGFVEAKEYEYSREFVKQESKLSLRQLNMEDKTDRERLIRLVNNTIPSSRYAMTDNPNLMLFYLTSYMSGDIYYIEELDLAAVATWDEDRLLLVDVFCEREYDLNQVINALLRTTRAYVTLSFTPVNTQSYQCVRLKEAGTTFFVKGQNRIFKGRLPVLSHA